MTWALVPFCLASLASAFVADRQMFLAPRVAGGIGMGAEGALAVVFLGIQTQGRSLEAIAREELAA